VSNRAKVAFVGAGSFVFGPTLLSQCIVENRIEGVCWHLFDPNVEAVELMASVGKRMADLAGVSAVFDSSSDLDAALDGADFVVCCAAVDMNRRFLIDREIIQRIYPEHLISEFGGVNGISSSVRQMTMMKGLAFAIGRNCPSATLLNISNPLPRVCQMAHDAGVDTVGFCSVSLAGFGKLHEIFHGGQIEFPFAAAREEFEVEMGGTNHLSWLVSLRDRATGKDLLPELQTRLGERKESVASKCEEYGRRTGHLLMPGDGHVQDFLPLDGLEHSLGAVSHGSEEQRRSRLKQLEEVAAGRADASTLLGAPSWERPSDFISARLEAKPCQFTSLNLSNRGQIPELPQGMFVETAATVDGSGARADRLSLPVSVVPYAESAVEINGVLAEAVRAQDPALVHQAVELDPTIGDKEAGHRAIGECLAAHGDVIGGWVGG
jgi:alpha-galactosidase